jgi:methyl-accepting chemotaxis protein
MKRILFQSGAFFLFAGLLAVQAENGTGFLTQTTSNETNIVGIIVAGVVAAALIIALMSLFIGQWSGKKQITAINLIRSNIEKDEKIIKASLVNVDKNTAKIQQLLNTIEKKSSAITTKQHQAWIHAEDLEEMLEDAAEYTNELQQNTESINQRITQVQGYWDEQFTDTADVVERVQSTLTQGLKKVEGGLKTLQQNEEQSREISQRIIKTYQQQSAALSDNALTSNDIKKNLQQASEESKQLLQQLNEHKETAQKSFQQFNADLGGYKSQANKQFDNVFQATDIARQELTANINESRHHIDNLRRYESEGRAIKLKTRDHLDTMKDKSIEQFATTLEKTQQMFATLQNDVQDAQYAIETLKKIKKEVLEELNETDELPVKTPLGASNSQAFTIAEANRMDEKMEYKAISGDSTLVPFFSLLKKQKK